MFKNICESTVNAPYLMHPLNDTCTDIQFCPYEDVLGVGHQTGFTSLLAPGAGEPNPDFYEANPYQSKSHRSEAEVRSLLDKVNDKLDVNSFAAILAEGLKRIGVFIFKAEHRMFTTLCLGLQKCIQA